jgi:hypothetical protein
MDLFSKTYVTYQDFVPCQILLFKGYLDLERAMERVFHDSRATPGLSPHFLNTTDNRIY